MDSSVPTTAQIFTNEFPSGMMVKNDRVDQPAHTTCPVIAAALVAPRYLGQNERSSQLRDIVWKHIEQRGPCPFLTTELCAQEMRSFFEDFDKTSKDRKQMRRLKKKMPMVIPNYVKLWSNENPSTTNLFIKGLIGAERGGATLSNQSFHTPTIQQWNRNFDSLIRNRTGLWRSTVGFVQNVPAFKGISVELSNGLRRRREMFSAGINEAFGLTAVSWTPNKPIGVLRDLLEKRGVLLTQGFLGADQSLTSPGETSTGGEFVIMSWKPKEFRQKRNYWGLHPIVVVGAEEGGAPESDFVYLADLSRPCPVSEARFLLKVPYQRFCRSVVNNRGEWSITSNRHFTRAHSTVSSDTYLFARRKKYDSPRFPGTTEQSDLLET